MHLCECLDGFEPASAQEWELNAWSGGCTRKNRLQCEGYHFTKLPFNLSSDHSSSNATGGTAESCKFACMTDCSCTAYSYCKQLLILLETAYFMPICKRHLVSEKDIQNTARQ
ncbi:hypothetical protein EJ110_NYTH54485 [Nymphaea thermarum]|nr:hypothetical protein EJ110_NYTH54485 [Nymphaea thermarum]